MVLQESAVAVLGAVLHRLQVGRQVAPFDRRDLVDRDARPGHGPALHVEYPATEGHVVGDESERRLTLAGLRQFGPGGTESVGPDDDLRLAPARVGPGSVEARRGDLDAEPAVGVGLRLGDGARHQVAATVLGRDRDPHDGPGNRLITRRDDPATDLDGSLHLDLRDGRGLRAVVEWSAGGGDEARDRAGEADSDHRGGIAIQLRDEDRPRHASRERRGGRGDDPAGERRGPRGADGDGRPHGRQGRRGRLGRQARRDRHDRHDPASDEPRPEQVACPGQAPPDGRLAQPQFDGGLGVRLGFEVAEHQRSTEPLGQSVDLLVQCRPQRLARLAPDCRPDLARPALPIASPAGVDVGPDCHPVRHAMEPRADRVDAPDRPGLADQHQERRLEGVLHVVEVAERPPADGQDHRPVPLHQGLERHGVAAGEEPVQELLIALPGDDPLAEQRPDLPQRRARGESRHEPVPFLQSMVSPMTSTIKRAPRRPAADHFSGKSLSVSTVGINVRIGWSTSR